MNILIVIIIISGIVYFIDWLFGWHIKLNYTQKRVEVWFNCELIESFGFGIGDEQITLDKAKEWIKNNKKQIEKYS